MATGAGSMTLGWWARLRAWRGPTSARARLLVALAAITIMVSFVAPLFLNPVDHNAPRAHAGVIDYAGKGLSDPVELTGQWRLLWLGPGPARGRAGFVAVPGLWTGARIGGETLGSSGRARYELVLRGLAPGR